MKKCIWKYNLHNSGYLVQARFVQCVLFFIEGRSIDIITILLMPVLNANKKTVPSDLSGQNGWSLLLFNGM